MEVLFDNRQNIVEVSPNIKKLLYDVIETTLIMENMDLNYEVSVSFVTNKEIRDLNKSYRHNDKETDVLSFPFEDKFDIEINILGDIVISMEKAREQAIDFGHTLERELAYLTLHSMLHLIGYDHMTEEERQLMRFREKAILKKLRIFK